MSQQPTIIDDVQESDGSARVSSTNSRRVYIFDTTLRDGEQSPGVSLNLSEKIQIARQLALLGVDIIEAGFPIASTGDFEAVRGIAREVRGVAVAGLARANFKDIDRAWEALKEAEQPRIHTFLATSPIHMRYKLQMEPDKVLEMAVEAVKYAKKFTSDVEFSAEDGSRSDLDFLSRVVEAVIKAGATTVNIPDTVGYAMPQEYGNFIRSLMERVPNIDQAVVSVHCHNDLGLAVANSLAAVQNGVRQVEGAINGIGERAGNAAIEEIVMALRTRKDFIGLNTNINTEEIYRTSKLVSKLTGMIVQANKAIVGKNAFAHESGIHQDGVLKERSTYEIMNPAMIGINQDNLVLGKHSGRHAFRKRLGDLGYELSEAELNKAFVRFKDLADKKKNITDRDLEAIVEEETRSHVPVKYIMEYFNITSGSTIKPMAMVGLLSNDLLLQDTAFGDGPVDAIYKAIDKIAGINCTLLHYSLDAITGGRDAQGDVTVKISNEKGKSFIGRGVSTDILEASAKAYVDAVNKLVYEADRREE
ncbi:2-isopropylmalate synthase [Desulfofarcimen acetoxidans DSM 771]|uniref:2-isopropylmalate synthase n=1 Tax=Desulfofarcimen acetoxidans (strain ATCC 49208 / DSM 771 / KCTC 5769 / VKM B-1644 / 5575) TaxID=485916 RepID=C8W660_DESAS|nr:2-isopropylmalate synthase [Desulfofarcimen acetoxidans]ACV61515.1 2-isopropylmalate synthase [Desulfofarcimen acetoxidans DSM 771]